MKVKLSNLFLLVKKKRESDYSDNFEYGDKKKDEKKQRTNWK